MSWARAFPSGLPITGVFNLMVEFTHDDSTLMSLLPALTSECCHIIMNGRLHFRAGLVPFAWERHNSGTRHHLHFSFVFPPSLPECGGSAQIFIRAFAVFSSRSSFASFSSWRIAYYFSSVDGALPSYPMSFLPRNLTAAYISPSDGC